jgi:hypothetical protein
MHDPVSGVACQQGCWLAAVFFPFGHPTPYAYAVAPSTFCSIADTFRRTVLRQIGQAGSLDNLLQHLHEGFVCHFGAEPDCNALPISTVFVVGGFHNLGKR